MKTMTSMERVLKTLSHQEPDRVPQFLLLTMHGARELGMSIREYFSKGAHVAEGQLRLRKKYRNDCLYTFFYAPLEIEAFGGEVIFTDDGPPNSAQPIINNVERILTLEAPDPARHPVMQRVYEAIDLLNKKVKGDVPIIGVVMSPFSLPVMQMGFDHYLEIMHFRPDLFTRLMAVNQAFTVAFANAQLGAGATAICYFDPVSSPTIIPRKKYLETGWQIAKKTISQIKGPTATHFASGRSLTIVDDVATTGTAVVGVSAQEDIGELKAACLKKLTVMGNLNGIEMRNWDEANARHIVLDTIRKAAPGGGFILSDNHGEIPYQVPEDTLLAISEAVHTFGTYPISFKE